MIEELISRTSHLGELRYLGISFSLGLLVLMVFLFIKINKSDLRLRHVLLALIGLGIFRMILFYNPIAWFFYYTSLGWEEVGFRQSNVITHQLRTFFEPPKNIKYMAIGSSQTGSIYSQYAKTNKDFYKLEFAGMGPADYLLYRDFILDVDPQYLLLHLSEFDLAREPSYDTLRYAPFQGLNLLDYFDILMTSDDYQSAKQTRREMLLSSVFPEYKYSFIFKGLLKKVVGDHIGEFRPISQSLTKNQFAALENAFSEAPIDLSMRFLEAFFSFCIENKITVVVTEGQYHPDSYSPKNMYLNAIVRERLLDYAKTYPKFIYLNREQLPQFDAKNFNDAYHVNSEAGAEYTRRVIEIID